MNPQQTKNLINFAFWGTPNTASNTLQILIDNGYIPSLVITNPDKPQGRGLINTPSPTKVIAEKYNITVLTPEKIDEDFIKKFENLNLELSIVVAYGKILPEKIINIPKYGTINIHYSLLPQYRGASPVESALLNGDTKTGVTIQKMVKKMDAGDIIATKEVNIGETIKKEYLRQILIQEGAELLIEILPLYIEHKITLIKQNETEATYCTKIQKQDGEINLNDNPKTNYNKYRAYEHWPGVFFFKDGKRIKITKARYENNSFIIERVIPEGKKEIDFSILK